MQEMFIRKKKMSQIATTIEQSKGLLAAGLDPESADMWWTIIQPLKQVGWELVHDGQPYSILSLYKGEHIALASFEDIPAWSLSRLIDLIAETGLPMNYGPMKDSTSVLDHAVNALEYQLQYANH